MAQFEDDKLATLIEITLDEQSIGRNTPDVEQERELAILDLVESNYFELADGQSGPYTLRLSIVENRLVFNIADEQRRPITAIGLALSPFRSIVKDYFLICDSYFEAIKTAPPSRIEAIDIGRRSLHNEGSQILQERLKGKIKFDFDTSRRLFTLICVLHWKG